MRALPLADGAELPGEAPAGEVTITMDNPSAVPHAVAIKGGDADASGETVGQAFVVIGGVSAMLLALFEFEYFWIANVIYLCFVLSAILSAIAKLVAYRSGMPRW